MRNPNKLYEVEDEKERFLTKKLSMQQQVYFDNKINNATVPNTFPLY